MIRYGSVDDVVAPPRALQTTPLLPRPRTSADDDAAAQPRTRRLPELPEVPRR